VEIGGVKIVGSENCGEWKLWGVEIVGSGNWGSENCGEWKLDCCFDQQNAISDFVVIAVT
jgi:hypothetical protein